MVLPRLVASQLATRSVLLLLLLLLLL